MTIRTKLTTGFKMSSSMVDILREVEQMAKGIRTNRSTFGFWSTSKQCFQITLRIFQFAVATFNHWIYIILWRSLSIHLQSLFLALDNEYCLSLPNSLHVAFCFLAGSEVEGVGSMVRESTSFFSNFRMLGSEQGQETYVFLYCVEATRNRWYVYFSSSCKCEVFLKPKCVRFIVVPH